MLPMYQHSMFACTLICVTVDRGPGRVDFEMRRVGNGERWYVRVPTDSSMIATLSRPGACFALVELASVAQAESRGRF